MNKRNILLTFALLFIAISYCAAQSDKKITVPIKNAGSAKVPQADESKHKHHDAEFFRKGNSYWLTYYQVEEDTLRSHGAIPGTKDIMTMAEYYWNKDTIVVRLFNTTTKKEFKYKAFGYGKTSSMRVD